VAVGGADFVEGAAFGGVVGVAVEEVLVGDAESFGDAFAFVLGEGDDARGACAAVAAHGAFEAEAGVGVPLAGRRLTLRGSAVVGGVLVGHARSAAVAVAATSVEVAACVVRAVGVGEPTRTATMVWSSARERTPVCL